MSEKYSNDEVKIRAAKKEDMSAVAEMIQVYLKLNLCHIVNIQLKRRILSQ